MINDWLIRVTASETPPGDIVAFNIGLLQTQDGYSAYLTGAKIFDADDDDWACAEDFSPKERYCPLGAGATGATGVPGDWQAVQMTVADQLKSFLASPEGAKTFLASAEAVTVGFDDGELVRVS